jgi:hypothetical protein
MNEIQIVTAPTIAQFWYYVFHSSLAPACFGLTAIIKELTLTYTAKTYVLFVRSAGTSNKQDVTVTLQNKIESES